MLNIACRDPAWHQVAFVNDKDDLFVCLFFLQILEDRLAHRSHGIAGVQYVENDIRGVDDFVELAIDTP